MNTVVNGTPTDLPADINVAELLQRLGVTATRVAVLVNDDVVMADRRAQHLLHDGDRVEILTFAGGG